MEKNWIKNKKKVFNFSDYVDDVGLHNISKKAR